MNTEYDLGSGYIRAIKSNPFIGHERHISNRSITNFLIQDKSLPKSGPSLSLLLGNALHNIAELSWKFNFSDPKQALSYVDSSWRDDLISLREQSEDRAKKKSYKDIIQFIDVYLKQRNYNDSLNLDLRQATARYFLDLEHTGPVTKTEQPFAFVYRPDRRITKKSQISSVSFDYPSSGIRIIGIYDQLRENKGLPILYELKTHVSEPKVHGLQMGLESIGLYLNRHQKGFEVPKFNPKFAPDTFVYDFLTGQRYKFLFSQKSFHTLMDALAYLYLPKRGKLKVGSQLSLFDLPKLGYQIGSINLQPEECLAIGQDRLSQFHQTYQVENIPPKVNDREVLQLIQSWEIERFGEIKTNLFS